MQNTAKPAGTPPADTAQRRNLIAWAGVMPFFIYAAMFLLLPSSSVFVKSFLDDKGNFTLMNLAELSRPNIVNAYSNSIQISAVTALVGGIMGFAIAYAVSSRGMPWFLKPTFSTFSGVASNFAGVPLAFAFISTLGRRGLLTLLLKDLLGIDIYAAGFNFYSSLGIGLAYLYFQFPLMLLVISPALEGLKKEWREAAEGLGATPFDYWRRVGFPILLPSLLGTMLLLFGNSFGAIATAYAITGGSFPLITILIGDQIKGDVLQNIGLGNAMALGMIVIMSITISTSVWLQRRSERWLK
jgi:putative spermidine/putrescine transport system permease protein